MQGGDLVDIPDYMQSLTLGTKYLHYLKICIMDLKKGIAGILVWLLLIWTLAEQTQITSPRRESERDTF